MKPPTTRRLARISTHGGIDVISAPLPPVEPGHVLIRTECSLISPGTEMQWLRRPALEAPEKWIEFGYQSVGTVVEAPGCPEFAPGDRVACMGASYAMHTAWAVVPRHLTVKLEDGISSEESAFSNLLATALHAVRRAELQLGEYVAVFGLGIVGQIALQIARCCGAHGIGLDSVPQRRDLARQLGAEAVLESIEGDAAAWRAQYTRGHGLDAAILAFGGEGSAAIQQAASVMKTAPDTHAYGRIVLVGGIKASLSFPTYLGNMDLRASSRTGPGYHDKAWERGAAYPDALVPWSTQRNLEECLLLLAQGRIRVQPLITHRITLEEVPAACRELMAQPGAPLGVIVRYPED